MKSRVAKIIGATLALLLVATGVAVASMHKSVTLTVDGQKQQVAGFMSDVSGALSAAGIVPGEHDVVTPGLNEPISNGTEIDVRFGRPLEVKVDGVATTYWTTERNLAAALEQLGVQIGEGYKVSEETSRSLGREGLSVEITSPKAVTVKVDGQTKSVTSTAASVADLLKELGISLGARDRVSPAAQTAVTAGLAVAVDRVVVKDVTRTEAIAFATTKQNDATMYQGNSKTITKGIPGSRTVVETQTIVNGKVESVKVLSTTVTKQPSNAVVKVGTKPLPARVSTSGKALNLANAAMWDRIARCESGNRWNINTGNGYYGGLQFNYQTWLSVGGADFAPRADLATREEQITVANRLYAKRGLQPWGCRHAA